jgi:hypothetical protein
LRGLSTDPDQRAGLHGDFSAAFNNHSTGGPALVIGPNLRDTISSLGTILRSHGNCAGTGSVFRMDRDVQDFIYDFEPVKF